MWLDSCFDVVFLVLTRNRTDDIPLFLVGEKSLYNIWVSPPHLRVCRRLTQKILIFIFYTGVKISVCHGFVHKYFRSLIIFSDCWNQCLFRDFTSLFELWESLFCWDPKVHHKKQLWRFVDHRFSTRRSRMGSFCKFPVRCACLCFLIFLNTKHFTTLYFTCLS